MLASVRSGYDDYGEFFAECPDSTLHYACLRVYIAATAASLEADCPFMKEAIREIDGEGD